VEWGWLITPDELRSWIVEDTPDVLVVNKPPHVLSHPSKHGPWSSLIGACRELLGLARLHMPSRLDRETSGVIVFAKNRETAARLQRAAAARRVEKTYLAVLTGELPAPRTVAQPIGRDDGAAFRARRRVREDGEAAETEFVPLAWGGGYTLARVRPRTGRRHQIRVHASWMGHAVAGDKLYGPDPDLMLEFLAHGFSGRLEKLLPLGRQALHAASIAFQTKLGGEEYGAPLAPDLAAFCYEKMKLDRLPEGAPFPLP
jgi:23S rRNA pseudouridine1911/1915/1917 synthase